MHHRLFKIMFLLNIVVMNTLKNMYVKYGSVEKAHKLFYKMHDVNIVSLTEIIGGYAIHGYIARMPLKYLI